MPKYIPNKTAEIEEIQNEEIRMLTKALREIADMITVCVALDSNAYDTLININNRTFEALIKGK